jgi:hypothetical protein
MGETVDAAVAVQYAQELAIVDLAPRIGPA